MSCPSLPPELCDRIVDHLYLDRASLKTCSLLSRSWLPTSRYHLFGKVTVNSKSSPKLIEILGSPHCTIRSYVHDIELVTGFQKPSREVQEVVLHLAFPALRTLHFWHLHWNNLNPSTRECLTTSPTYQGVKTIACVHAHFETLAVLIEFISRFPRLEHLSFRGVSVGDLDLEPKVYPVLSQQALSYLHKLTLSDGSIRCILRWIVSLTPRPRITTMNFSETVAEEIPDVMKCLDGSVEFLRIGLQDIRIQTESGHNLGPVNLAAAESLKKVYIDRIMLYEHSDHSFARWVAWILAHAPHAEEIDLCLLLIVPENAEVLDWALLMKLYNFQRPELRCVRIWLGGWTDNGLVEALIRERLAPVSSRGVLQFPEIRRHGR